MSTESFIKFANTRRAVGWAEEIALRPQVTSQIDIIRRARLQISSGYGLRHPDTGDKVTPEEIRDLAHSISVEAHNVKNGMLYCIVYGSWNKMVCQSIAEVIASEVIQACPDAGNKRWSKITSLVMSVVENIYYSEMDIDVRLSSAKIAERMGIHRQSLRESGWPDVMAFCYGHVQGKLAAAENELAEKLSDMGVLA